MVMATVLISAKSEKVSRGETACRIGWRQGSVEGRKNATSAIRQAHWHTKVLKSTRGGKGRTILR